MKFLVPIDFSANSFHAATYATALAAAKPGSSVHLIHVLTPILDDLVVIKDIEEEALKSLDGIRKELLSRCTKCNITCAVKIGETIEEINNAAENLNVGLIVMGIQGMGKTQRFLFGSNTRSLFNKAHCPVLVIPETSAFGVPKKIVFATDYYDSDVDALERLVPIATAFNSEIIMVHIFDETDEEQSELIMMNFFSNEIFKTVQYPRITYRVFYNENTPSGLRNFCEFTGADLIVLSARKQTIFQKLFGKSVTKDLTYNSDIPMLIFHVHRTDHPGILD